MVAELALGNRQLLAGGLDLSGVAVGEPVEGVKQCPRAVVVAGEQAVADGGSFQEHFIRAAGVKLQAEGKAAVGAEGKASGFAYPFRQSIDAAAEDSQLVIRVARFARRW